MWPTRIDHLTKAFSLSVSAARTSAHDLGISTQFELRRLFLFISFHHLSPPKLVIKLATLEPRKIY